MSGYLAPQWGMAATGLPPLELVPLIKKFVALEARTRALSITKKIALPLGQHHFLSKIYISLYLYLTQGIFLIDSQRHGPCSHDHVVADHV
jgi:hypothetical protein